MRRAGTKRPLYPYESDEQAAVVDWAQLHRTPEGSRVFDHLVMIPNESLLRGLPARVAYAHMRRLRQRGFRDGASDLFLAYPASALHGLWVEMKRQRAAFGTPGRAAAAVSSEQQDFGSTMVRCGFGFVVAYGQREATDAIEAYLDNRFEVS